MTDSDKQQKLRHFFKEWVLPVIIALAIVLLLNKYVFILVTVPTGSMENTILPGDRLFVNELFDIEDVKRGDILVFKSDELDDKRLVKRLIGLPGETVEIERDGSVYINGEKIDEPYAISSRGEEKVFVIPEGSYFFLGDNRPISYDARYWQDPYISEDKVIGKVEFRFFPLNRIGKIE
ncbi:MAG TPA: signal peptidase I [Tissierellia bacterium]|jgi:signal peptidase I|nr:signal peptidase I [Sedimentibacter sp.]HHY99758.1 signal peptidase I [Tissierellia bacterium]HOK49320.1 signal peptidase I [Sedimentibacter sp.]